MRQEIRELGIDLSNYGIGTYKTTCPRCSPTRKKKHDTCLSVTVDHDFVVFNCHHCNFSGKKYSNENQRKYQKIVELPTKRTVDDTTLEWFSRRGISRETVEFFKIYNDFQSFGEQKEKCICFPYYHNYSVINVKYRANGKKFKQIQGAKRSLFNFDNIDKESKEIIFVEGEMDVMAMKEATIDSVSLPDGAPSDAKFNPEDKRFQALKTHPLLEEMEKIIIAVDNDSSGKALEMELAHRFGKDKCWYVEFPDDCKDANETIIKYGKGKLRELVDQAKPYPIDGLYTIKDFRKDVYNIYDGNVKQPISTGFPMLDEIYKVMTGTFNLVTGVPNHGKSNFIDQLAMNLAKREGWNFAIFSPEHSTPMHIRRLAEKYVEKPFDHGINERMTKDELTEALNFLDHKFFFVENTDDIPDIEWILKKMRSACIRNGVKGIIIDPYNEIADDNSLREDIHIRNLISACKQFCRSHEVVIWMVAHPHKMSRIDGVIPAPSLYDVSGAAHWNNMADVGLVIHRDFEQNETNVITRKIREQGLYGTIGVRKFHYDLSKHIYIEKNEEI